MSRMPAAFLPHGGGPVTHVELGAPRDQVEALARYWRSVRDLPKVQPKAVVVVSAHWEEAVPTVMSSPRQPMLYDYYGFPPEAYKITWPAPGDPAVAERVRQLLSGAGFTTAEDRERGFDHGTFTPLKQTYPDADIPVVQLSLKKGLDAAEHLAMGRALAPLRDEGVFLIGSGDTFHNLREFFGGNAFDRSVKFDEWLSAVVTGPAADRLYVWFEPDFLPGYAWSFPLPDGRVNLGFGVLRDGTFGFTRAGMPFAKAQALFTAK